MRLTAPVHAYTQNENHLPPRQLRSRPIDLNKKLPIICSVDDLNKFSSEDHNLRIEPSSLGFKADNTYNLDEFKEKYHQKRKNISIPTVSIKESKIDMFNRSFFQPDHYIRHESKKEYVSGVILSDGSISHFDILKEDEIFLQNLQKQTITKNSLRLVLSENNFCKLIDAFEKASGKWGEGPGEINFDEALKIKNDLCIDVPSHIVKEVHNHWKQRRNAILRPLERAYWQHTKPHDISPFAVFRPRVSEKMTLRRPKRNKFETIEKLEKFLDFCRKVEKLIKKMKQRDERKLALLELNELLFEQMSHEIFDPLYKVPHWEFLKEKKFTKASKKSRKEKDKQFVDQLEKLGIIYPSPIADKGVRSHPPLQAMQPLSGGYITTATSSSNYNEHLRIIRRRGRGGRIWIDRKKVYGKPLPYYQELEYASTQISSPFNTQTPHPTNPDGSPEIGSSLTSFDLYNMTHRYSDQAMREQLLETLLNFDDDLNNRDARMLVHPGSVPDGSDPTQKTTYENQANLNQFFTNLHSPSPTPNSGYSQNITSTERPAQDDWESLQSFRSWLRYSLAPRQSMYNEHRANTSPSMVISVKP